jgi:hypothetical protein
MIATSLNQENVLETLEDCNNNEGFNIHVVMLEILLRPRFGRQEVPEDAHHLSPNTYT